MARNPERVVEPIPRRADQLVGRRLILRIEDHLRHLHAQPAHGNRCFFYDQLVIAHLLAFFNPLLHSLRCIEDVFELPAVRRRFGIRAAPKSTVADCQRLFDPQLLQPILDDLKQRAKLQPHDVRLDQLTRQLTAVDGTFFAVAGRVAWAIYNRQSDGGVRPKTGRRGLTTRGNVRAHVHFDILRGVPEHFTLTGGQASEGGQLQASLQPEHCYVLDRGFQSYALLGEIIQANSDFVVRLRKSARYTALETRPLSAADLAAGVVSDTLVRVGWRADQTPALPVLRRVEVRVADQADPLALLTSCLDLPAELIALIYQHRWQIELFFRWLKCMAHLEHFFSESPQGMTLQLYVTLIATLLIALETGARPSVYDFSLMSFALSGQAPLEEVLAVAAKRRAERERAARRRREKAAKKNQA
jgi:IS4 transposase